MKATVRTRFWAGLNSPEAPFSGSGSPAKNRFLGLGIGFKFPVLKLQINWEFHLRYFFIRGSLAVKYQQGVRQ